jgi:hypothetical protein
MDPSTIYGQGIMQSKPGIGNAGKYIGSFIAEMVLEMRAYKHMHLQIDFRIIPVCKN